MPASKHLIEMMFQSSLEHILKMSHLGRIEYHYVTIPALFFASHSDADDELAAFASACWTELDNIVYSSGALIHLSYMLCEKRDWENVIPVDAGELDPSMTVLTPLANFLVTLLKNTIKHNMHADVQQLFKSIFCVDNGEFMLFLISAMNEGFVEDSYPVSMSYVSWCFSFGIVKENGCTGNYI